METIFFCARNVWDYLSQIKNVDRLNLPADNSLDVLTNPTVQKLFRDLNEIYPRHDEALTTPIVGETGIDGLRLDFNFGLRLDVPHGNFRVKIGDVDGQTFFDAKLSDVRLVSVEKFFIRWTVEIFHGDEKIFAHAFDLHGQKISVVFDKGSGLGDKLAFLPYLNALREVHGCRVTALLTAELKEFAAHVYPQIDFVDAVNFDTYATFYPLTTFGDFPTLSVDLRNEPLERIGGAIFGVDFVPDKPKFKPTTSPVTAEPYVCIGVQAGAARKGWLWRNGWNIVVAYLKSLGYRVFCIDRENFSVDGDIEIRTPSNAEDFTGDLPILHRANMLYHAEFFIGLSSGLSWLAEAVNCPVVMICGFSRDWSEFYTPWRVANRLVCNGCVNDMRVNYFRQRCPYHSGTPREFECQRKISPRQVINAIERLIVARKLIPPILRTN